MNLRLKTNYEELIIEVVVITKSPEKIRVKAYDFDKPKSVFTDRWNTVDGKERFIIRMPLSRLNTVLQIYNEANGNKSKGEDDSFRVVRVKKLPLVKRTDVSDIRDLSVKSFVDLAQRFAYNASYIDDNEVYESTDEQFYIKYLPYLTSGRTGKKLATPARINSHNGQIEVSKREFDNYTIPMRMVILLHEFSHFYRNKDKSNETEADLNGLLIYLSLGYPRIEAYQAFLKVFQGTPSEQNKKRYDVINNFIHNFEKKKIIFN